jgi:hypothetical protein
LGTTEYGQMMSDLGKILFTSFLTVFTGTLVYVISKVFLDSWIEQRKFFFEIRDNLLKYKHRIVNPGIGDDEKLLEASDRLKSLESLLISKTFAIPLYSLLEKTPIVKKISDIKKVEQNLRKLSANICQRDPETRTQLDLPSSNIQLVREICDLLGFEIDI